MPARRTATDLLVHADALELGAYVEAGSLRVDIDYARTAHHADTIERLAAHTIAALRELIDAPLVPDTDLSVDEFEHVLSRLGSD